MFREKFGVYNDPTFERRFMSFLHLAILAIVQGITEFLPISSSAHLILVPQLLGEADQGLMIDIGAHAGTLLAVILFFWRDSLAILRGCGDVVRRRQTDEARLTLYLALATIPCVLAGLAILSYKETLLRHIPLIIISNVVWGIALWCADKYRPQEKTLDNDFTWKRALFIGLAQVIALIPGTSRSGITMTAGRYLGFTRLDAARISLLLSIPITTAAVLAMLVKMAGSPPSPEQWQQFGIVAILSFVTSLLAVWGMMHWLKRFNFTPFVIYRLLLAVFLVFWLV